MNKPDKSTHILEAIIALIEGNEWGKSGRLPSRRQLARTYDVSTATIDNVFILLHASGYVRNNGGSVVVNPQKILLPALVPEFISYLKNLGLTPYQKNIGDPDIITLNADLALAFGLPEGMQAVRRQRVQGEDQKGEQIPYRIAETHYPMELAERYLDRLKNDPNFVLINQVREDTGRTIASSSMRIQTRFPNQQEQSHLQISPYTPVIDLYRTSRAADGTVIMFSKIVMISYRFVVSITNAETLL